jgi:hypothetical protein
MYRRRREIAVEDVLGWLNARRGQLVEADVYFLHPEGDMSVLGINGTLERWPHDGSDGLYRVHGTEAWLDITYLPEPLTVEVFEEGELEEDYLRVVLADRVVLVVMLRDTEDDQ